MVLPLVTVCRVNAALSRPDADPTGRRLMIERGIGYWIDPDGGLVPVAPRVSHADVARALISEQGLSEDDAERRLIDVNAFAIGKGWTRVRIYPQQHVAYVDFGQGRRRTHARMVDELIDQLGLAGVTVKYTDVEGNYVSP